MRYLEMMIPKELSYISMIDITYAVSARAASVQNI
jgi:hypothetical protein